MTVARTPRTRRGLGFWIGLVIGGAVMAFGVGGLLDEVGTASATAIARWVIGAALVHDLLLAPVAVMVGWAVGRIVPPRMRAPVQAGLIASAIVLIVGWAPLRGFGRTTAPDNSSVQPLDYATAVLTALGIVWGTVAAWSLVLTRRRNSRPSEPSTP